MSRYFSKPLFVFEMANNHQGSIEHGQRIVREIKEVTSGFDFNFAFKFQYRNIDTFIHPDYRESKEFKYVKRFSETRLREEEFKILRDELKSLDFIAICTPFDEESCDLIEKHDYDIVKIGSCSFTDWPLLERIAGMNRPVIASTAGVELGEIDKVVSFFRHRCIDLSLMHCVAEYPTRLENLQLNQINLLRERYAGIRVGFSTHEDPENYLAVMLAVAKGAAIFEKHVGVPTDTITLNAYSAKPAEVRKWLESSATAFSMCGVRGKRYELTGKEKSDLTGLKRGVFALRDIRKGEVIRSNDIFCAIPGKEGQLRANDLSKYREFGSREDIAKNAPLMHESLEICDRRSLILSFVKDFLELIKKSHTVIPVNSKCELSHHYGIQRFREAGAAIINCINREYCKKVIVLLQDQVHPVHHHKLKEETFNVLYGELKVNLRGEERVFREGETILVERGTPHSFSTSTGAVFEEISTKHYKDDSYYEEEAIKSNRERKTEVYMTEDLM